MAIWWLEQEQQLVRGIVTCILRRDRRNKYVSIKLNHLEVYWAYPSRTQAHKALSLCINFQRECNCLPGSPYSPKRKSVFNRKVDVFQWLIDFPLPVGSLWKKGHLPRHWKVPLVPVSSVSCLEVRHCCSYKNHSPGFSTDMVNSGWGVFSEQPLDQAPDDWKWLSWLPFRLCH